MESAASGGERGGDHGREQGNHREPRPAAVRCAMNGSGLRKSADGLHDRGGRGFGDALDGRDESIPALRNRLDEVRAFR